jgi:hypothetical protein
LLDLVTSLEQNGLQKTIFLLNSEGVLLKSQSGIDGRSMNYAATKLLYDSVLKIEDMGRVNRLRNKK